MSSYGRRYDVKRVNELLFNATARYSETKKYKLITYSDQLAISYVCDHTDYVILCAIHAFRNGFIRRKEFNQIYDKIEGYFYAFEEGMLNAHQVCWKLNREIMEEELNKVDWNFLGVYA